MANGPTTSPGNQEVAPTLTFATTATILCECAWEAAVLAFFVRLFGSIAVGIVGGIWHDMAPSPPPGFGRRPLLEDNPSASLSFGFVRQHSFVILAAAFFALKSVARFAGYSRVAHHRQAAAWAERLFQRASEKWFHLVVGNAFGALIAAIILQFTGQFTFTHFLWQFCIDLLRPLAHGLGGLLALSALVDRLGALFRWYSQNQFKFTFWFFYTAAICDDLGLPNFKTLGRYAWRRLHRCKEHAALQRESPSPENPAPPPPGPCAEPSRNERPS